MAESVDALVSNTSGSTRAGSTPALGTLNYSEGVANQVFATLFIFTASKKRAKSNTTPLFYVKKVQVYHYTHTITKKYSFAIYIASFAVLI